MKKILLFAIFVSILACRHRAVNPYDPNLPGISMLLMDSVTRIHTADIPEGEPIVFIYFQPDCIHCQEETTAILQDIASLKAVRIYMLTPSFRPVLRHFYEYYKLAGYTNIKVGVDEGMRFYTYFNARKIPFLAVYNKDRQLIKAHAGTFSVDNLLKFIGEFHEPI